MDTTQGTIWNKILLFALPLRRVYCREQLFNSAAAVVGWFANSEVLAASGKQRFIYFFDDKFIYWNSLE